MWPLFCLALMIWKESKSNNSRWKRMKIIKPYWHHTKHHAKPAIPNFLKIIFHFSLTYFFPFTIFLYCALWLQVCESASLPYLFTYFPFFLFSCFILLFIDFNSPNVWAILKDTSCLLLVFFFFQIGFSEITKTCTHVHRLPLKRLTRLKKKVIQSWREFYIRFPAANPSCQTL